MVNKVSVLLEYQSWVVDLLLYNYDNYHGEQSGFYYTSFELSNPYVYYRLVLFSQFLGALGALEALGGLGVWGNKRGLGGKGG